ncbi:sugar phosphate isomerase/epimerase family protein [Methanofollis ethanolicus]|uniref:sugar phosphate isomerase/epimerase family protein n=1 Tax=Methanofollis ethanolicus TaxID=488124 RepID=UPI00082EE170|nr:sugar phosphate isomerase/epimerase [Methanofollis ethanolicus]
MTVPVGASTYCLMDRPLVEALEALARAVPLVEILSDSSHSLFSCADVCTSFDLRYTVHAPTSDLNIATPNERMREASVQIIADLAVICDEIGAERLVIHPGFCMERGVWAASEAALLSSLSDLSRLQEGAAVTFAIENMGSWSCCHFRDPGLLPVLDDLGLGFALDVGHACLTGTLDAFLREGRPVHLHLHDNRGTMDEHAACGSGCIDFSAVRSALSPSTTAVIEVLKPAAVGESLVYLDRMW